MNLEYLIFNLIIITGPILSIIFYPKIIKPKLFPTSISIISTAAFFIIWDILVTGYFWEFNPNFILGIYFINIPVEELLFFFTVPLSCLLIFVNLKIKSDQNIILYKNLQNYLSIVALLIGAYFFILGKIYTSLVLILLGFLIFIDYYITKTKLLFNKSYYKFFLFIILLTLLFNYYLTVRPVVIYNQSVKTNINIFTIPIEDFIYSFILLSLTAILYLNFKNKTFKFKKTD